ncbi:MAG: biotin--[acetyl-CoA-carboxylase] ligase [Acidimicrobiales bacterium]
MILDERTRRRLAATTRFGDVRQLAGVDSTNRWLAAAAAAGAPEGLVVVADHQWAGRGRLGRSWVARPGAALLVSVLLRPPDLAPTRLHLVTAAMALAAAGACRQVSGVSPDLKWPNDLVVGEAKLAGILAETASAAQTGPGARTGPRAGGAPPAEGPGAVVVGLGLNVTSAPAGATSLSEAGGAAADRGQLLGAVLAGLESRCGHWAEVARDYRQACATVGRVVRVSRPAGELVGLAEGIDDDGALLVRRPAAPGQVGTVEVVAAADVVHLRAGGPAGPDARVGGS